MSRKDMFNWHGIAAQAGQDGVRFGSPTGKVIFLCHVVYSYIPHTGSFDIRS